MRSASISTFASTTQPRQTPSPQAISASARRDTRYKLWHTSCVARIMGIGPQQYTRAPGQRQLPKHFGGESVRPGGPSSVARCTLQPISWKSASQSSIDSVRAAIMTSGFAPSSRISASASRKRATSMPLPPGCAGQRYPAGRAGRVAPARSSTGPASISTSSVPSPSTL